MTDKIETPCNAPATETIIGRRTAAERRVGRYMRSPDGHPDAAPDAPPPAAAASADAPAADAPTAPAEGDAESSVLGGAKPDGAAPDAPAADAKPGDADSAPDADGPPAAYEGLNAPEGFTLDDDVMSAATPLMRGLGIADGEPAQAFIDQAAPIIQSISTRAVEGFVAQQEAQRAEMSRAWVEEGRADPEIGGANYERTVAHAGKFLDTFGSQGLRDRLTVTGLGNDPELLRAFGNAGAMISEGAFIRAEGGQETRTTAQKLYGAEFQSGS